MLLTLPAMLLLVISVAYPVLWSLNLSLHSFDITNPSVPSRFVGLQNYAATLSSSDFQSALIHTAGFVAATLTLELIVAFAIALLLNMKLPGIGLFRLIFSTPLMVAPVVAGLLWRFMFADPYGIVNSVLAALGIQGPPWLATVSGSWAVLLVANLWLATPFDILVLLAGMASLPDEPFEAARIDGARNDQLFRYIMLPLLRPALLIILIVRLTDAFRVFDIVYIITGAGPGNATDVLSSFIYRQTFTQLQFAPAAAASFVMLAISVVLSILTVKVLRKEV